MRIWKKLLARFAAITVAALLSSITIPSQAAESFRDCPDCPLMVTIPSGSFAMGSGPKAIASAVSDGAPSADIQDETPRHDVKITQFSLAVTEVTRDQFDAFVSATGHQAAGPCWVHNAAQNKMVGSGTNDWRDPGFPQDGNHPVVCVSWDDANAYVGWLTQKTGKDYRLPTEAEWEYAAKAGTTTARYWGLDNSAACRNANVSNKTYAATTNIPCTDGYVYTAPVAQFQANAFGLNDMLGNVLEWTEDCHHDSYNGAPTKGAAWLTGDCSRHMLRGGSWDYNPGLVRAALRGRDHSATRIYGLGFRVARAN